MRSVECTYIAIQQYKMNKRKVQSDERLARSEQEFDLYERRLSVFRAAMELVETSQNMPEEKYEWPEVLLRFRGAVAESYFLFDQDVIDYLRLLDAKYNQFTYLSARAISTSAPKEKRDGIIENALTLEQWFGDQFEEARKKFSKYLSLRDLG